MEAGRKLTKDQEDYLEPAARKVAEAFAEFKEKVSELGFGGNDSKSEFFCREGCGCPDYLSPSSGTDLSVCERDSCGHSVVFHMPI